MVVKFNSDKAGIFQSWINNIKEAKQFLKEAKALSSTTEKAKLIDDFDFSDQSESLINYVTTIDSAQWSLQGFIKYSLSAANSTSLLSKVLSKATGFAKGFIASFANAAIWFIAEKAIEGIISLIQDSIKTQAKLDEAAQKAAESVDTAKSNLSDAKDELSEINQKIDDLLSKDALTFVEEQDLQNLREQKALLEDELALKRKILEEENQDYLDKQEDSYDNAKKKYEKDDFYGTGFPLSAVIGNAVYTNDQDTLATYYNEIKAGLEELKDSGIFDDAFFEEANEKLSDALDKRKQFYSDFLTAIANEVGTNNTVYDKIKADYIDFLKEIGDSATLVNYMDVTEGFDKAYEAAAKQIKSGNIKTADDLKEAIGDNLYQTFKEACDNVGIEVEDMIGNIYADLTDNLNSEYIADKISKANTTLAQKGFARGENGYATYLQEIEDFTNTLSDEQKQIYLGIVDSADTLAAAKKLYNESVYENNRQGYIDSHKIALSTFGEEGRRVTQVNASKETINSEFEDFINKLSETDYQIVLKLDVDASQSIEDIQKQIRDSKTEKTLQDVLSETFANADGEDAKLEDIVSTVTGNIDKIKAKIVEQIRVALLLSLHPN